MFSPNKQTPQISKSSKQSTLEEKKSNSGMTQKQIQAEQLLKKLLKNQLKQPVSEGPTAS